MCLEIFLGVFVDVEKIFVVVISKIVVVFFGVIFWEIFYFKVIVVVGG